MSLSASFLRHICHGFCVHTLFVALFTLPVQDLRAADLVLQNTHNFWGRSGTGSGVDVSDLGSNSDPDYNSHNVHLNGKFLHIFGSDENGLPSRIGSITGTLGGECGFY